MLALGADKIEKLPVVLPMDTIRAFCERWGVNEFALFGSVLRSDFRPDSDVDVLVTFADPFSRSLLDLAQMEQELREMFGRRVDLLERGGLDQSDNPYIRKAVLDSARVIHAR